MAELAERCTIETVMKDHRMERVAPAFASRLPMSCQSKNSPTLSYDLSRCTAPLTQISAQSPLQACKRETVTLND